jgi:hypothetical protein
VAESVVVIVCNGCNREIAALGTPSKKGSQYECWCGYINTWRGCLVCRSRKHKNGFEPCPITRKEMAAVVDLTLDKLEARG